MTTFLHHLALPDAVFSSPAASILLPIALGTAIGYGTRPDIHDPDILAMKQPPLRPPNRVFGPVWTVLYGLMGYAAYRAVGATTAGFDVPRDTQIVSAGLYTVQLGLNLMWMPLFFSLKRPVEATLDSVALLGINGYLAALWLENSSTEVAGWCMVPYVVWLSFATYLSAGAGYLNGWSFKGKAGKKL
ncbi:MAG: hypothetical protein STHCBS139747_001711 [Sporothrix thermara]